MHSLNCKLTTHHSLSWLSNDFHGEIWLVQHFAYKCVCGAEFCSFARARCWQAFRPRKRRKTRRALHRKACWLKQCMKVMNRRAGAKRKEGMELHAVLAMARELRGYKTNQLSAGHLKALSVASRRAPAVLPGEAR